MKSNFAIMSTFKAGLLIDLTSNVSPGENVTTSSGGGIGNVSRSDRMMYVPGELNGGEVLPGGTVTASAMGFSRRTITLIAPLFLTWKLATQCIAVSENNLLGK